MSNASPAASSIVAPSGSTVVVTSSTRSSDEWPPLTSSARHGSGSGPCSRLVDRDVRGQVVDAVQRLAQPDGQGLGRSDADEQGAGQSRPRRHRDRVDLVEPYPGGLTGSLQGRDHRLEVRPAGHLGNDTAEPRVLVHTARHGIGQQGPAADDPDTCLVARRLDAEDERLSHDPIVLEPQTWPSGRTSTTAAAPSR